MHVQSWLSPHSQKPPKCETMVWQRADATLWLASLRLRRRHLAKGLILNVFWGRFPCKTLKRYSAGHDLYEHVHTFYAQHVGAGLMHQQPNVDSEKTRWRIFPVYGGEEFHRNLFMFFCTTEPTWKHHTSLLEIIKATHAAGLIMSHTQTKLKQVPDKL